MLELYRIIIAVSVVEIQSETVVWSSSRARAKDTTSYTIINNDTAQFILLQTQNIPSIKRGFDQTCARGVVDTEC